MNSRLKNRAQRLDVAAIALAAIPVLLYIPVLHYSLNTPFALVDDYIIWSILNIFDRFYEWLSLEFLGYDWVDPRYRPFWEFYSGATWKVFGATPWLHHIARWAMHLGAVAAFAAAFRCFQRRNRRNRAGESAASNRIIRLLPLTALIYLWVFFPNQPAAKLSPQEAHTVFFLGICVWMTALTLLRQGKPQSRRAALLIYAAFCVGFCGLAWTKETNIPAALWLLVSYYALPMAAALRRQDGSRISAIRALKGIGVWKALGGLPLIAVFLHTLVKVYIISQVDGYGRAPLTPELLASNAAWIAEGLFQVHTSLIITAGLALLSAALLLFVGVNIAKKRFSDELVFTLFLLGLFASLYLILCASPYQALRYWYILIPVFAALLAFSTKFILEFAAQLNFERISARPRNLAAYALTAFIAFFVCCNYYNFLYQAAVQHISRHNEANALAEIARLHDEGNYIQISDISWGYTYELTVYFHGYLPWFYGREYNVRSEPPQEAGLPHYIVRHFNTVSRLPETEQNYRPLAYARRIADLLQAGSAYIALDGGAGIALWQIYDNEFNRIWWNGDALDIPQLVAEAGEPIIRSDFDIYLNDRRLIYINDKCDAADLDNTFFLAAFPINDADLPEKRRPHGFDNLDFTFANYGFGGGERCFAVRYLPTYPVKRIHTGQYINTEDGSHNTWEGEAVLSAE